MPLEERDVNTLTPEEMRELLQRQRKRDQACRAVKQEQGVKRERSRERCNTANTANNDDGDISFVSAKRRQLPVTVDEDGTETIDLT
jgi:topoisomerase IA-like protein